MKWTEKKDVILLTAMAGEGVFQWKHGSRRERECMGCSGEKLKLPERVQC